MNLNTTFIEGVPAKGDVSMDCSLIHDQSPPADFVNNRNRKKGGPINPETTEGLDIFDNKLSTLQESLMKAMGDMFSQQLANFNKEFNDVKNSLQYFNEKVEEVSAGLLANDKRITHVEEKVKMFDIQNTRVGELEDKIEILEQQSRQCNVEISNLPEKKAENLINIIISIGSYVKIKITPNDIVAVHRVARFSKEGSQPKNIIAKFTTRPIRDNFLAAVRRAKGIKTDQINISGEPREIFANEHLTMKKKILFRETRIAAKENGFRFVWSKNGNILVRQEVTSPVLLVKNLEDINLKIKQVKVQ